MLFLRCVSVGVGWIRERKHGSMVEHQRNSSNVFQLDNSSYCGRLCTEDVVLSRNAVTVR